MYNDVTVHSFLVGTEPTTSLVCPDPWSDDKRRGKDDSVTGYETGWLVVAVPPGVRDGHWDSFPVNRPWCSLIVPFLFCELERRERETRNSFFRRKTSLKTVIKIKIIILYVNFVFSTKGKYVIFLFRFIYRNTMRSRETKNYGFPPKMLNAKGGVYPTIRWS